jgi:hypothetical protein
MGNFFLYTRRVACVTGALFTGGYAWRYIRTRQKKRLDQMRYDHVTKNLPTLEEWDSMGKGERYLVCRELDEANLV